MAIAIKAIPTLYGEDAIRFRSDIERVDMACATRHGRDISKHPRYKMMKKIQMQMRVQNRPSKRGILKKT